MSLTGGVLGTGGGVAPSRALQDQGISVVSVPARALLLYVLVAITSE